LSVDLLGIVPSPASKLSGHAKGVGQQRFSPDLVAEGQEFGPDFGALASEVAVGKSSHHVLVAFGSGMYKVLPFL
jgi:hypothetical protein